MYPFFLIYQNIFLTWDNFQLYLDFELLFLQYFETKKPNPHNLSDWIRSLLSFILGLIPVVCVPEVNGSLDATVTVYHVIVHPSELRIRVCCPIISMTRHLVTW